MKFLDTSIIVEAGLEKSANLPKCVQILEAIGQGRENAVTSVFTIAELYHILYAREKLGKEKVRRIAKAVFDCSGLEIIEAKPVHAQEALELALEFEIDFVDAVNRILMEENGITEIYSLDSHFDRFKGIKRLSSLPSASKHFK